MKKLNPKTTEILNLTRILKNSFNQNEYKTIILPFIVLKRTYSLLTYSKQNNNKITFDNSSKVKLNDLHYFSLTDDIIKYIDGFTENIKEIFENLNLKHTIAKLDDLNLLWSLIYELSKIDLSIETISYKEMGEIFDELLNEFTESNLSSGPFSTPADVNNLIANLLLVDNRKKTVKIYDPACGVGRTLTACENLLSSEVNIHLYGQEINCESYALCKSNLLMRGDEFDNIKGPANTLTNDLFKDEKFDYIISDPPFGANWRDDYSIIVKEFKQGFDGRFGAGLPRKNDNQLLFIQHMISKMNPKAKSKIAMITSGSALLNGDAGSGESKIRKWIIENDYLETIIELPSQLFHHTNINTYLWILTNKKSKKRRGKIQFINSKDIIPQTSNSSKKKYKLTNKAIKIISSYYKNFSENDKCKILENTDVNYSKRGMKELFNYYLDLSNELKYYGMKLEGSFKEDHVELDELQDLIPCDLRSDDLEKFGKRKRVIEQELKKLEQEIYHDKLDSKKTNKSIRKQNQTKNKKTAEIIEIKDNLKKEISLQSKGEPTYSNIHENDYKIDFNNLDFDKKEFFNNVNYPIYDLEKIVKLNNTKEITKEYDFYIIPFTDNINSEKIVFHCQELPNNISKQIIGCKLIMNNVEKDYLYYFLNSNKGLELFSHFQKILSEDYLDVSQIPIPLPDLETQKEVIKTYRLMESFFNDIDLWKNNYLNNILDYKTTLESYKEFSCSIHFGDDGGVKDFCRNWRIVYQGLIWPLAYTYLKATKGSKDESTMKKNYLVLFEFLAAFNVIVLISAIEESDIDNDELNEINELLWQLNNNNEKTWHRMHFGNWTTLYSKLTKIFKNEDYEFITSINRKFLNKLSHKKYKNLFHKIRAKDRNSEAHSGQEDERDVTAKLDELKIYMENDIYDILNLYSGLKLYYITENRRQVSPTKIDYKVMSLNGPCDPPIWDYITTNENLEPFSLYLYDSISNSYLKLNSNLIRLFQITDSKQYGIYIFDSVDTNKGVAKYKCYQHSHESQEMTLNSEEDTYFKVSKNFLKDVLRL